jgi:hypothetical protein
MMTMHSQHRAPQAPRQEQYTVWYNPTDQTFKADVFYANEAVPTRFTFAPKQEVEVPSRFDSAIQKAQCGERACQLKGGWCNDPSHAANVIGGLVPLLQRKGANWKTLPALDPMLAELEAAKAQIAAETLARKRAEDATLLAAARAQELEAQLEAATRPVPTEAPAKAAEGAVRPLAKAPVKS